MKDFGSFVILLVICLILLALTACCPYAFKCGSADLSTRQAACPNLNAPKDDSFKAYADTLGETVVTYRQCQAVCTK